MKARGQAREIEPVTGVLSSGITMDFQLFAVRSRFSWEIQDGISHFRSPPAPPVSLLYPMETLQALVHGRMDQTLRDSDYHPPYSSGA